MLIKGEKYACDACVRGHRVSSCNHTGMRSSDSPLLLPKLIPDLATTDRPLIHINKKGRPVSQCPHCRGLRKARAQHVKCDCAEKAHSKAECKKDHTKGLSFCPSIILLHLILFTGNGPSCCCAHGGRCTCALKKEHSLTSVPETIPPVLAASKNLRDGRRPPRLSTGSLMDSKTTIFRNGHHKPVHKINDIHNRVGAPYKVPARSRTITGHGDYSPRSTDTIPLTKDVIGSLQTPQYSITSAPHASRQVKSEHGSPSISALPTPPISHVPPISIPPYDPNAYAYSPFSAGSPVPSNGSSPWDGGFPDPFPENYFVSYDSANEMNSPTSTAGLGPDPEIDWSTYNLPSSLGSSPSGLDIHNRAAISSHPQSYASYDCFSHLSHPGIASSSGDLSEVEDFVPITDTASLRNGSQDVLNDFSSAAGEEPPEPENYRLSSASSFGGMQPTNTVPSESLNTLDIDQYIKNAEAQSHETAMRNQRLQQEQHQQLQRYHSLISNSGNLFTPPPEPTERPLSAPEPQSFTSGHPDALPSPGHHSLPGMSADGIVPLIPIAANGQPAPDERDDGWVR